MIDTSCDGFNLILIMGVGIQTVCVHAVCVCVCARVRACELEGGHNISI